MSLMMMRTTADSMHYRSVNYIEYSATAWTIGHQAPLSMEFSRQEY